MSGVSRNLSSKCKNLSKDHLNEEDCEVRAGGESLLPESCDPNPRLAPASPIPTRHMLHGSCDGRSRHLQSIGLELQESLHNNRPSLSI